jgi:hypothetical protein
MPLEAKQTFLCLIRTANYVRNNRISAEHPQPVQYIAAVSISQAAAKSIATKVCYGFKINVGVRLNEPDPVVVKY